MKTIRTLSLAAVTLAWALPAHALEDSPMVDQGSMVLGAERITGIYHVGGSDAVPSNTVVAFLGNHGILPHDVPRVGFDYFVIDHLSVGGNFVVWNGSLSEAGAGGSQTEIAFIPRVGYALMFTDSIGFWPRGGLSYAHINFSPDRGSDTNAHYFAFDVDAPFFFGLSQGFAVTVGPFLDVGFGGSIEADVPFSHSQSFNPVLVGLSAGFAGFF